MKILFISTSDNIGGAAVATNRLVRALNEKGIEAFMLVRDKTTDYANVRVLPHRKTGKWRFLEERLAVFFHLRMKKQHLWEIDTADFGQDIIQMKEFQDADIIHLAWINQGMISLDNLSNIVNSGKPIVWTLHDLWPVSGICHYPRKCDNFIIGCNNCQLLPKSDAKYDLSAKVWNKKKAIYQKSNIHFVACSKWLAGLARQSGLTAGLAVSAIPNVIDTDIFHPFDKRESRLMLGLPANGEKIILFVSQKLTDGRKGASFLIKDVHKLRTYYPQTAGSAVVALLGSHANELSRYIGLPCIELGYLVGDELLARVYSAADLFILPSTEDNLPNTIMEALACGVPCIGFNVGGIPEMIDHKQNGFVASLGNTAELATGINWILQNENNVPLSENAVKKVKITYSKQIITQKYLDVYRQAVTQKLRKEC